MENKERLKSMLQNFIADNHEAAQLDFHEYMSDKMQQVSGFKEPNNNIDDKSIDDDADDE